MKRTRPVLVPFKLKWRDFAWLIAFSLLAIVIVLLSTSKTSAQVYSFSHVDYVTHQKDSSFLISLPDYLIETNDLNAEAVLQFKNIFSETYLMVMVESKSEMGNRDMRQLEDHFKSNLLQRGGRLTQESKGKINNYDSFQKEIEWMVDGEPLLYLVTFIDTPDKLFKVYCWTIASNKDCLDHFKRATDSFVLLDKRHSKI
jgi:hypothetical protein